MASTTWHKDIKSWKNINQFLFKNETMSDCSFMVMVGDTVTKVAAHKYILAGYSPEFYNLFYLMKASSDEIPIDDVAIESLSSFLEFLYTENTELNMENIGDIFKLADRYSVDCLKDFCGDFLLKNITVDNVLSVMDQYSIYELPKFETDCMKIINRKLCFQDPSFLEISNRTLTTILKSEVLKGFSESIIFEGTNKWAERFCAKMGQPTNSQNKRLALGSALQYIRFGTMSNSEFASFSVLDNSILTPKEVIEIFQFIGTDGKTACRYSGKKRGSGTIKISFYQKPVFTLSSRALDYEILSFSVNKPIFFHGFEMYGRDNSSCNIQNPEKFIIKLLNIHKTIVMENIVEIRHDGTTRTYEMLFEEKKLINADEIYAVNIHRQIPAKFQNYDCSNMLTAIGDGEVNFNITHYYRFCAGIIYSY